MNPSATLVVVDESHIVELQGWFQTNRDVVSWGGPMFRVPFTPESFSEDSRWQELDSFALIDGDRMVAFGQYYLSYEAVRLARLAVSPGHRRHGYGEMLIQQLTDKGVAALDVSRACLFVMQDNDPALALYKKLGFEIADYPSDAEMGDDCYFMTRQL